MNEEVKVIFKGSLKKVLIVVGIVALVLGLLPMMYVLLKDDFERISESNSTYSMVVNANGQVTYIRTLDDGTTEEVTSEDMADDFSSVLRSYIGGDEEYYNKMINYIIGAEAVTKLPYIEPSEEADESTLVGQIKFYRYSEEIEPEDIYTTDSEGNEILKEEGYRLTYVQPETFQRQLDSYKTGGNTEVFKHFTMDEEGNVVIAYGSKETRSITTEDADLTQEIIIESSGEDGYVGNYSRGFSFVKYTANKKKIDYLSLVEQYVMPSNLLYALLIQTKDIKFVEAVAELAYNNEIAIAIYDNKSETITNESYEYKKIMEIDGATHLDFTNIQTSDPVIRASNLYGSPYSRIPYKCYMNTNSGRITHRLNYYLPSETPGAEQAAEYVYVTGVDSSGKITSLGTVEEAKVFTTNFYKQINASSTQTIGIILADTWIARWKATYRYEENDPTSVGNEGEKEDVILVEYTSRDEVLNAFDTTMKNNATTRLNEHKEDLKQSAIDKIVNSTDFTVTATSISVDSLSETKKKEILEDHIDVCEDCSTYLRTWYGRANPMPPTNRIYEELNDEEGDFVDTQFETHYENALRTYVYNENQRRIRVARQQEAQRKEQFTTQLENQITVSQTLTGDKLYTNITFTTSYSRTSAKYKREEEVSTTKEGEKFSEVFNRTEFYEARQGILARDQWLWEYIRANEDTAKLEDMLRYLLNIATGSNKFGTFTEEEIEELFKIFEPGQLIPGNTVSAGTFSPFGCIITREEFIEAAQSYNGGSNYYKLADAAEDFYDVCTSEEYNVNPCLAFAWACIETGYGGGIPYNNLFGMAIGNGQSSGTRYATYADSIEDFCKWVVINSTSDAAYARGQEFATVNSKFIGTPETNAYVLFCRYAYLGDTHIADEPDFSNPAGYEYYIANGSTWGAGGRIYTYYMYELGGLYTGEYATRCGHPNGSDPTTLQEQADYAQYTLETRVKVAKTIFGNGIFVGAEGQFQEIEGDPDIYGIYTSSSGRVITGWRQTTNENNSYGHLPMFSPGKVMGNYGCNVYAYTMLLNSIGLDVNPGIVHSVYRYEFSDQNDVGTIENVMEDYGANGEVITLYQNQQDEFLSALLDGRVVITWVSTGFGNLYTSLFHWIALVDIRETQLGSIYGYDIFALTSGYRGHGWQPIETVIDNLASSSFLCYYIRD